VAYLGTRFPLLSIFQIKHYLFNENINNSFETVKMTIEKSSGKEGERKYKKENVMNLT
jgi:hypothetical protein